jgi:hypothetical protein
LPYELSNNLCKTNTELPPKLLHDDMEIAPHGKPGSHQNHVFPGTTAPHVSLNNSRATHSMRAGRLALSLRTTGCVVYATAARSTGHAEPSIAEPLTCRIVRKQI